MRPPQAESRFLRQICPRALDCTWMPVVGAGLKRVAGLCLLIPLFLNFLKYFVLALDIFRKIA